MRRRAQIVYGGSARWGEVDPVGEYVSLTDGQIIAAEDARWLPPVVPGATIFALGLNFADHNAELGFKTKEPPLVFLKGPNTLVGHCGEAPLPSGATQMHPECELVAIIGKPTRNVSADRALAQVSGYTIACDYAIRDYLENYLRPNLRVKNRDATTPIGPWVIDARDIPDPQALAMETRVNGVVVQQGSTADMILSVAELIAHLSEAMTLMPGDMILTGTPKGVHFVQPGDEVTCSIEKVGTLLHHVRAGR